MSQAITREQRAANIKQWRFQQVLMHEQGFKQTLRKEASGLPKAYEHHTGNWRISTAKGGKWKLERWYGRYFTPPGWSGAVFRLKVWAPIYKYFDTPLAVALWFNLMVDSDGNVKEWAP